MSRKLSTLKKSSIDRWKPGKAVIEHLRGKFDFRVSVYCQIAQKHLIA